MHCGNEDGMIHKRLILVFYVIIGVFFVVGCGYIPNPMEYMIEQDNTQKTEGETDSSQSTEDSSLPEQEQAGGVVDESLPDIAIVGTCESTLDSLDSENLNTIANITFVQEDVDGEETDDLAALAVRINEITADSDNDAVVILTKLQYAEEIAYFLNLTVKTDKPLVVAAEDLKESELNANIETAVMVAGDDESKGKGVLFPVGKDIYGARDISPEVITGGRKDQTPIGSIDDAGMILYHDAPNRKHTTDSVFEAAAGKSLPYVTIEYDYLGNDGLTLERAVQMSDGVVIVATAPDKKLSHAAEEIAADCENVVVVSDGDATGLSPVKARLLLMLALDKTSDEKEISGYFAAY